MNEVTCYKKDGRIYFRKKDIPYKRYGSEKKYICR